MICGTIHFADGIFSVSMQFQNGKESMALAATGQDKLQALERLYFEMFGSSISILKIETSENRRILPQATMICRNGGEPISVAAEGKNSDEAVLLALVKANKTIEAH
jgi:hypothetical protein